MGTSDFTWNYGGWNIDDVELIGTPGPPAQPGLPDLLAENDSGVSDVDNITGAATLQVDTFVFDPMTTAVAIWNNGQKVADAIDQGDGFWRYIFSGAQLAKGDADEE